MAAKRFMFRVTLDSGIVQGMDFASITSEDLPAGLGEVNIGMPVGGANEDGSILFVDPAGLLANEEAGFFAWDSDGSYSGGVGKLATLYIGDATASGDGGRLALRDPVTGNWLSINYRNSVLNFVASGGSASANFQNLTAAGSLSVTSFFIASNGMTMSGQASINAKASGVGLIVTANVTTPGDVTRFRDNTGAIGCRLNKDGYFMTRKTSAPADADLANSEVAFWLDPTPGATVFNIKARDSGGTVRTATVPLA